MTMFSGIAVAGCDKIQRLVSPGGTGVVRADATVPLIAMEYSFGAARTQDPADKPGVGNMVASLLDEGSGDLDLKTSRTPRSPCHRTQLLDRDHFRGSLRMLKDNKDGSRPAADGADLTAFRGHRRRTDPRASVSEPARHHQPDLARQPQVPEVAFGDHPYGRPANGTLDSVPKIDSRSQGLCPPRDRQGRLADRRSRRCRRRYARRSCSTRHSAACLPRPA